MVLEIVWRIIMRKGLKWNARSKRGREAPKAMSVGARGLVTLPVGRQGKAQCERLNGGTE